jgi:hypothetical protein
LLSAGGAAVGGGASPATGTILLRVRLHEAVEQALDSACSLLTAYLLETQSCRDRAENGKSLFFNDFRLL